MNNSQIEINGILGSEGKEYLKTSTDNVIFKTSSKTQEFYKVFPNTNGYVSYYIFSLGVIICLIVFVLYNLKRLSK
jgi:hypothetical protein